MLKEVNENLLLFSLKYLKQKEYWRNKLPGNINGTGIFPTHRVEYTTYREPQVPGKSGIIFPGHLCGRILKLSKNSNLSLYIVLLSGLKSLIYRYTGEKDILVLSPVNKLKVSEETINNQVPIYDVIDGDISFKGLLLKIRQSVLEAYENQDYPFDKLMEYLFDTLPSPDLRNRPIFDIACVLKNIHRRLDSEKQEGQLVFVFEREEDRVKGAIEYDPGTYEEPFIEQIAGHFIKTLENCIDNIDIKISEISFLSEEEKKHLLFDFNNTRADYPQDKTIHELFAAQVEKTPDRVAAVCESRYVTYSHLNQKANHFALLLREKGVRANTIVGIQLKHSLELLFAILGILKAGGAYLPIDPDYPQERIDFMLKDSGARLLVTTNNKEGEKVRRWEGEIYYIEEFIYSSYPLTLLPSSSAFFASSAVKNLLPATGHWQPATSLAYVIYTSGTSGGPKGVMLEHRSVVNYTWWAIKTYIRDEKIDFPLYTSISFDLTVTSIFPPLLSGNAVVIYPREDKFSILERVIDENRVGIVKVTPSHLKLIRYKKINQANGPKTTVKRFIVGGENLETQLTADIYDNFNGNIEIYNEYGPTEAAVGCMIHRFDPGDLKNRFVPIGIPAANTRIYISDGQQNPVPPAGTGELCIGGDGVARGYLNQPELTAERFIEYRSYRIYGTNILYKTGDLARWLPDGNIECIGRKDDQVKIRGCRIEPGEIESRLQKHEKIKEAVVLAKEESLCAYIVSEGELTVAGLREYLSAYLPYYMIPSYFVPMEKMPLTPNGKLDLKRLPEPTLDMGGEGFQAPRDKVEEKLAHIWSEVLGIDEDIIGINSNFFEIGGHSLKAMILMAKIHKEFNVKILLEEIFNSSTIKSLAEYIKGASAEQYKSISAAGEKEYYPLSLQQNRFYILQQMNLESTAYNLPQAYILTGNLDENKLEETFGKMIKRHESFRTSFQIIDRVPVQKIHDEVEFKIENCELAAKNAKDREDIIKNFIKPFDLSHVPLLRVGLVNTGDTEYLMLTDMHHIITDGISVEIMAKEFMALYGGEELPSLPLQYKDYSEWQNSGQQQEGIERQREFWLRQFPGEVPVLRLPCDFPRPQVQGFAGDTIRFKIEEKETTALKKLALEENVTLFMVLLAAYNVLLSKLCTQEDIILGTGVAGRRCEELKNIIGLFFNTLPLRNYPTWGKKFKDFLQEVKKSTLEVFDNQDYPYDHLVRELTERKLLTRDPGRNPLFDTMFGLQNFAAQVEEIPEVEIPGLNLKPFIFESNTSKFDLFFIAREAGGIIFVTLEYASTLFKRSTVGKIIDLYNEILKQVTENRNTRLKDIKISSESREVKSHFKTEEYQDFGF